MNWFCSETKARGVAGFAAVFVILILFETASGAPAATDADVRTTLQADLAGQYNPDGVMLFFSGYRRWISGMDPELRTPSSYFEMGAGFGVSPAEAKAVAHIEWQPAVFAAIRVEYDLYRFFGDFGALLSFPSADSKFGSHEVDALKGHEERAWGRRVLIQPTLYAKAGPVIIRNQTDLAYYRFDGKGPFFLDWEYDTLLKKDDSVIANRTEFLTKVKSAGEAVLLIGPYYEITHARDADISRQRIGGLVYWSPMETIWSLNRPRVYSQIGMNIQDRNRENEIFFTLGLGFDIDL